MRGPTSSNIPSVPGLPSAVGAPSFSPARKRWVRDIQNAERRRYGSPSDIEVAAPFSKNPWSNDKIRTLKRAGMRHPKTVSGRGQRSTRQLCEPGQRFSSRHPMNRVRIRFPILPCVRKVSFVLHKNIPDMIGNLERHFPRGVPLSRQQRADHNPF